MLVEAQSETLKALDWTTLIRAQLYDQEYYLKVSQVLGNAEKSVRVSNYTIVHQYCTSNSALVHSLKLEVSKVVLRAGKV